MSIELKRFTDIIRMTTIKQVTDLKIYQLSERLADKIWEFVRTWNRFEQDTIGKNLVHAADSISLNLAEGFGRYSHKDVLHFSYIARGSSEETESALRKAYNRNLLDKKTSQELAVLINAFGRQLNGYIREQRKRASSTGMKIGESGVEYLESSEFSFA